MARAMQYQMRNRANWGLHKQMTLLELALSIVGPIGRAVVCGIMFAQLPAVRVLRF